MGSGGRGERGLLTFARPGKGSSYLHSLARLRARARKQPPETRACSPPHPAPAPHHGLAPSALRAGPSLPPGTSSTACEIRGLLETLASAASPTRVHQYPPPPPAYGRLDSTRLRSVPELGLPNQGRISEVVTATQHFALPRNPLFL